MVFLLSFLPSFFFIVHCVGQQCFLKHPSWSWIQVDTSLLWPEGRKIIFWCLN
jgi:hypothetical protein